MIPISAENQQLLDSIAATTGLLLVEAHGGEPDAACFAFPVVFRHADGRQVNADGRGSSLDAALHAAILDAQEQIAAGKAVRL